MSGTSKKGPLAMTTDRDDIASLLERVKAATGSSRELDRLITEITGYPNVYRNEDGSIPFTATVANFTGSVDAALALVERLAPTLVMKPTILGDGTGHWQMTEAWCGDIDVVDEWNPWEPMSPPLAILAALLTSLKENHRD